MITLRQLKIFVEVVRAGSFRRCADALGMSQVSVSEHVRTLEERLGVALFDRRSGGAPVITEKGRIAHAHIADILASVADLMAEMEGGRSRGNRRLAVSLHSFLTRDLPPALHDFSAAHATIDVCLDSDRHLPADLIDMVSHRMLDVAYFYALGGVASSRLVRYEPLAIFVGEDHPLADRAIVDIDQLMTMPSIQLTPRDPLRDPVDRAFASIGLSERRIGIETDDFGQILGSTQRGLGYACLFEAMAKAPARVFGLKKLTLNRPLPALEVRCATRSTAAKDTVLLSFINTVEHAWERFSLR